MASPTAEVELRLASSMRVSRNITPLQDLIAAWPLLQQKSIASPSTLTEFERRLFLDLPPEDVETSNIRTATILSREQLIEKAISTPEHLTDEESVILQNREAAYENIAFRIASMELAKRLRVAKSQRLQAAANLALPDAQEWIQHFPEQLDTFERTKDGFFRHALMYNGARDIINTKWDLVSDDSYPNGAILRKAFKEILIDPQKYQNREDVAPTITYTGHFKDGIAKAGFLTNTFLLIDPICIKSIVVDELQPGLVFWEDMRVLAFEADFPVLGREYEEGYKGFTWVRLDQLIYNFYQLRLMKADEVGMDKIWKAAQKSRHQAFVSMDPEEALINTNSCGLFGFTPESVIGRRWYPLRDAKEAARRIGTSGV